MYDLVVIGGGVSGMSAAISAAATMKNENKSPQILLIEKNKKLGKKIYATGNGKCNLGNTSLDFNCYESENEFFPFEIMTTNSYKETVSFFRDLGIEVYDDNGYLYPMSLQASTVVWALTDKLKTEQIEIHLSEEVEAVQDQSGVYSVYTDKGNYQTKNLILACGGAAASKLGGSMSGYTLAASLHHNVISPRPGLCKLKTKETLDSINGVRSRAEATLYIDDQECMKEVGELQFTTEGLSGIMIFNLSIPASAFLEEGRNVAVSVNLMPEKSKEEILRYIHTFVSNHPDRTLLACLNGLVHEKISRYILERFSINQTFAKELNEQEKNAIAEMLYSLVFHISGTGTFEDAQVACGGIDTKQINPLDMSSKLQSNLFIVGEMLDVTGKCGGYNIMWAVITGIKAGNGIHI